MSLPVPSGARPSAPSDHELQQLATSPGWAQAPNDWLQQNIQDEDPPPFLRDSGSSPRATRGPEPGFLDDDDGLPLSMELRGSDLDHSETIMPHYWDRIFSPEERERRTSLNRILRALRVALMEPNHVFENSLPRLARLQDECPFEDVQSLITEFFQAVGKDMAMQGLTIPTVPRVSTLFRDKVFPITTTQEPQAAMFKASFLNTGRVLHLYRILSWHPEFLERLQETQDFILRGPGPLPYHYRNYLAILAASRFKCHYLVQQQESEFLANEGEADWLKSTSYAPVKIQKILEVNAILAHQPWRLLPSHISELVRTADSAARWSIPELVHAFVIFASFRALAGIAIGLGLNPEVDISLRDQDVRTKARISRTMSDSEEGVGDRTDSSAGAEQLTSKLVSATSENEVIGDAEQRQKQFEAAGDSDTRGLSNSGKEASTSSSSTPTPGSSAAATGVFVEAGPFAKYTEPHEIRHTDFDVKSKDYTIFHIQDWMWEEHAYELLERTYDCASLLDTEFTTMFELTYNQVNGQEGVDTTAFRRSIWYYVHRVHGILHDDYNYATVNELLLRNLKKFTKDLTCTPYVVTAQDFVNLGYSLAPEEKCHIALLATEARKQAELMYALYAVSKHLSSS